MSAIQTKNKGLQKLLLSGSITNLDLNVRSSMIGCQEQTVLHFAVRNNDYDLMKTILEYPGSKHVEVGLKDVYGKSPIDLAQELKYSKMFDLLQKYGAHPSLEI